MNVNTNKYNTTYTNLRGELDTLRTGVNELRQGDLDGLRIVATRVTALQSAVSKTQSTFFSELGKLVSGKSIPFNRAATNRNTVNFQIKQMMSRRFFRSPTPPKISKMKEILDAVKAKAQAANEANATRKSAEENQEARRQAEEQRTAAAANFNKQKTALSQALNKLNQQIGGRPPTNAGPSRSGLRRGFL